LINACYGGDVFGDAKGGGSPDELTERGAYAITAGPDDKEVYATTNGQGSLFFESIVNGIKTGDADLDAQKATLGMAGSLKDYYGIVRLGELDGYLTTALKKFINANQIPVGDLEGNRHHWFGSVEPTDVRADGGFFFFQHPPKPAIGEYQANLQVTASFAPSTNQIVAALSGDAGDGLDGLRSADEPVRGIDVSHINGSINWTTVAAQKIRFAYIKATESSGYKDKTFSINWLGAQAAGIAHGAYHRFSFCTDPHEQFTSFSSVVPKDPSALPVALDIELFPGQEQSNIDFLRTEGGCAKDLGNDGIRRRLKALADSVGDAYGHRPIIYGNNYVLDRVLTPAFTNPFALWRAKYGLASHAPPSPWSIWQFTENERIDGINGAVDVNVLSRSEK
jgi:lysozyme